MVPLGPSILRPRESQPLLEGGLCQNTLERLVHRGVVRVPTNSDCPFIQHLYPKRAATTAHKTTVLKHPAHEPDSMGQ